MYFWLVRPLLKTRPKALLGRWSGYGLAAGALAAAMGWVQYRCLILDRAVEGYGLVVALLFAGIGIWLGRRLAPARTAVRHEPTAPQPEEKSPLPAAAVPVECPAPRPGAAGVSAREQDVLRLVCRGLSNAEIAAELFVSPNTVKTHVSSLLFKLDAKRRTGLVERARVLGLLEDGAPPPNG